RHVASGAIRRSRVLSGGDQRIDRLDGSLFRRMALPADRRIMRDSVRAPWNVVRVMARLARELAFAFQKTLRLPQPVCGRADNLKLIVMPGSRRMIEAERKAFERLPRNKRKRAAIEAYERRRNPFARRFEMALQAHLHAQLRIQPGRIHNRSTNVFRFAARRAGSSDVLAAGSVTALAVDPLRQIASEDGVAVRSLIRRRNLRNSVMA